MDSWRGHLIPVETNSPLLNRLVWSAVAVLVAIGVLSGIARSVFVDDLVTRAEPLRQQVFQATGREDPLASTRSAELEAVDGRFARHRLATLLHVLTGAAFLGFVPLQFSSRIRRRHIGLHRWSGRLLVLTGFLIAVSGLYFGLLMPYAGAGEVTVVAFFGGLFLVAISKAFIAIRRRDVARHRAWMIRAFAVGIGIATARLVGPVLDFTLTPAGFTPRTIFVLALWLGWGITVAAAELWLAHTRPADHVVVAPDRRRLSASPTT